MDGIIVMVCRNDHQNTIYEVDREFVSSNNRGKKCAKYSRLFYHKYLRTVSQFKKQQDLSYPFTHVCSLVWSHSTSLVKPCDDQKSAICRYLSSTSNMHANCIFLRHTGHRKTGRLSDSSKWFDPFIKHS